MLNSDELKTLVTESFEAEKDNNIEKNQTLLHAEFKMIDMVISEKSQLFPSLQGADLQKQIEVAFPIEGRKFIFKSILADEAEQKVIVEFIESYPDPKTKKIYRTPQIAVCEIKDGLIYRTRHYMDPRLSHKNLSSEDIKKCFK